MDFNCDHCGRSHEEDSTAHDCSHSLCYTCNIGDDCPRCKAVRVRRQAEEDRINKVTDCCICMDTIQITNRAVTECGHVFCLGCLLQHLDNKNDCPMCRRTVGPQRCHTPTPPRQQTPPRRQTRCGLCHQPGHNRRTCRQVVA